MSTLAEVIAAVWSRSVRTLGQTEAMTVLEVTGDLGQWTCYGPTGIFEQDIEFTNSDITSPEGGVYSDDTTTPPGTYSWLDVKFDASGIPPNAQIHRIRFRYQYQLVSFYGPDVVTFLYDLRNGSNVSVVGGPIQIDQAVAGGLSNVDAGLTEVTIEMTALQFGQHKFRVRFETGASNLGGGAYLLVSGLVAEVFYSIPVSSGVGNNVLHSGIISP